MAKFSEHKATPYIICDFETGGLDMKKNALTEIAMIAIKGDTLEEIGRYESLIKPYGLAYDPKAIEVTGLTPKLLEKEGKDMAVVFEEVTNFLKYANINNSRTGHKPVMIAHNAGFEVMCFQALFATAGKSEEMVNYFHGQKDYFGNFVIGYMDTVQIAKWLWSANARVKNFKLTDVCEKSGISLVDAHRAMNDVIPTTEFVRKAIKMLRAGESGNVGTVGEDNTVVYRKHFQFD